MSELAEILNTVQHLSQKSAVNIPATQLQNTNETESIAKTSSVLPILQLPFKREVLCVPLHSVNSYITQISKNFIITSHKFIP